MGTDLCVFYFHILNTNVLMSLTYIKLIPSTLQMLPFVKPQSNFNDVNGNKNGCERVAYKRGEQG